MTSDNTDSVFAKSLDSVDALNTEYYRKFPYPPLPTTFDYFVDPELEVVLLNQNVGDWKHLTVPKNPKIWVAGCGTSQAIFTALRFPRATVLGSDLSSRSLEMCAKIAQDLGISNLTLQNESINHTTYKDQFDYIICTGVIHHMADPQTALSQLTAALKSTGILEVMVYNRYHRIITNALQEAIRMLHGSRRTINSEAELSLVKTMIDHFPVQNSIASLLAGCKACPDGRLADALLQPIEYTYTVASLEDLAASCGLELVAPHIDTTDKVAGRNSWNMDFTQSTIQESYHALPDTRRWHVANLLLLEQSPLLWFYLQRQDSGRQRKSEQQICEEFLDTAFVRIQPMRRHCIRDDDGTYRLLPEPMPFPMESPDSAIWNIIDSTTTKRSMRETFRRLGIEATFQTVNRARMSLTTSGCPYLRAVSAGDGAT